MIWLENTFSSIVRFCILLIEMAGIVVIVISMVRGLIDYIKKRDNTRIQLAQGIMLGLEFKIGSEVLRSVIVSGWTELGTLAAIILLRSLLTLLLHWEIDVEEKRQREKDLHGAKMSGSALNGEAETLPDNAEEPCK